MFSIGIQFKNSNQWGLLFKTEERARASFDIIRLRDVQWVVLEDDFGTTISFHMDDISGALFEDYDRAPEAQIERSLANARMQAKLQGRAASDPIIKSAAMVMGDLHRMNGPMRS